MQYCLWTQNQVSHAMGTYFSLIQNHASDRPICQLIEACLKHRDTAISEMGFFILMIVYWIQTSHKNANNPTHITIQIHTKIERIQDSFGSGCTGRGGGWIGTESDSLFGRQLDWIFNAAASLGRRFPAKVMAICIRQAAWILVPYGIELLSTSPPPKFQFVISGKQEPSKTNTGPLAKGKLAKCSRGACGY